MPTNKNIYFMRVFEGLVKTKETRVLRHISYGRVYISTIQSWPILTSYSSSKYGVFLCSKVVMPEKLSTINQFWERTCHEVFWVTKDCF